MRNFNDDIRTCFENHYMNKQRYYDDSFNVLLNIDKTGVAKDIHINLDSNDEDRLNSLSSDFDDLSECISNIIAKAKYIPPVIQQDIPLYYFLYNPYSSDVIDFEKKDEDKLKACAKKGKVKDDYYGFTWVIHPDGSVSDVSGSKESSLNKKVQDCYINIIKNWEFNPTINKLYMYYEFNIGEDKD